MTQHRPCGYASRRGGAVEGQAFRVAPGAPFSEMASHAERWPNELVSRRSGMPAKQTFRSAQRLVY